MNNFNINRLPENKRPHFTLDDEPAPMLHPTPSFEEEEFQKVFYFTTLQREKEGREFILSALHQQRESFKKLIEAEMLICHHEGTPTSRLTSLWNKL